MPKALLTDVSVRAFPVLDKQTDYWDTKLPAFGVRVSPGGTKTFILNQDKARRTIGRYGVISLSEARTEAKRLMADRTLGNTRPNLIAYDKAVKLYLEDKAKRRRARTIADYTRHLNLFGFKCQVDEITTEEIERKLKGLGPGEFNHRLVSLRIFFNWALKRRYVKHNPTLPIEAHETTSRKRKLADDELQVVWRASLKMDGYFPAIVRLLIVCGQRRGETAAFHHSFYSHNQQTVTLPGSLTKNKLEHVVPLGPLGLSLLKPFLPDTSTLLFPARGKENRPFNGWSKCKRELNALIAKELPEGTTMPAWTLHDLRRTYRSNLGRLGIAPHIAERLINHVSNRSKLQDTYDVYEYLDERRTAQETYENWLAQLLNLS